MTLNDMFRRLFRSGKDHAALDPRSPRLDHPECADESFDMESQKLLNSESLKRRNDVPDHNSVHVRSLSRGKRSGRNAPRLDSPAVSKNAFWDVSPLNNVVQVLTERTNTDRDNSASAAAVGAAQQKVPKRRRYTCRKCKRCFDLRINLDQHHWCMSKSEARQKALDVAKELLDEERNEQVKEERRLAALKHAREDREWAEHTG